MRSPAIDWNLAVCLAREGRLTTGEIADRCGWPETRSLSAFAQALDQKVPRRRRGLVSPAPAYRVRNVEVA